ncbi:MAG: hypothetical protein V4555_01475 [Acidobacteriota bacterium]
MNRVLAIMTLSLLSATSIAAQQSPDPADPKSISDIEHRIDTLTEALTQTQKALQDSLLEIQRLRTELNAIKRSQQGTASLAVTTPPALETTATPTSGELEAIHEQLDMLAAQVKQHDQIKVETASKYPLRVTGLALFNAYNDAGVVDDSELASYALPRFAGGSHGSGGATLRQTILGFEANGPNLAGARTSASLNVDFFGGTTTSNSGYSATAGYVRIRTGNLALDWQNTTLEAGYFEPLITPRAPTSYAVVAHPALAASGNLWAWAPQLRVEQRLPFGAKHAVALEAGLLYPAASNYANSQLTSPVSASRHPGIEGRLSYRADRSANPSPGALSFGVSGYSASQFYSGNVHIHSWAVTGDYNVPFTRWLDLSGEFYRGTAIGALGGGSYNDVLFASDYLTTAAVVRAVATAGGWTQLKARFSPRLEANAMYGIDDSFKRNLDDIVLLSSTNFLANTSRNQTFGGNLIFRPKAALIFSPEYRHIETWGYKGTPNVASIFTLSAGYQF